MALLPLGEALDRLLGDVAPIAETETVPLAEAAGRVLGRDLAALRTQPPFSASAMDGYAVRAEDIATVPATLTVLGEAAAGHGFAGSIGPGEAVRIFTGAPVPEGADTVLIQENATPVDPRVIRADVVTARGRHIRVAGLDFREGDVILKAGMALDAGRLTLAAAMNHPVVPVRRRPVVAIIATGDELVAPGTEPGPDQIVASNSYGVAAIVAEHGGVALDCGIVPDRAQAIEVAVKKAIAGGADILVTLGGASVGDHDLVQDALKARGMALDFWRIAMRPGKPLMFGRLGALRVLGLPGNPVASLVCGHLFLRPLVARLAGRAIVDSRRTVRLGLDVPANDERQDYLRARLENGPDGLVATPFPVQDSSMMRVFAESDCLIVRPPHAPAAKAGEACIVECLRMPAPQAA